jgi:hypothetical protein
MPFYAYFTPEHVFPLQFISVAVYGVCSEDTKICCRHVCSFGMYEEMSKLLAGTPLLNKYFHISTAEFLATDPEARDRFPALPEKKSSGSGTGSTQPRQYI